MKRMESYVLVSLTIMVSLTALCLVERVQADPVAILECLDVGAAGDRADLRGIRFTVDQEFSAVEVRMQGSSPGIYSFSAELRRSTGFLGPAEKVIHGLAMEVTGDEQETPYLPIRIDLGEIPLSGSQTFTLKFTNVHGPGMLYFETFGIGKAPCEDVEETDENNVASPTVRGDPAGFRVLAGDPLIISSSYTNSPPTLDGVLGFGEWPISNRIQFQNGFMTVVNDRTRLYVLLDVLEDDGNDVGSNPDYFWLSFDVDRDGVIKSNFDLMYGTEPSTGNMRYSYYLGPGSWTGVQPETYSSMGKGFGCFFGDWSRLFGFWPDPGVCNEHRVWEFGIDLMEIGAQTGGMVRMGLRVASTNPSFVEQVPSNMATNFTDLIQVQLGAPSGLSISPNIGANVHLEAQPLEMTQAIQNRNNTVPLVKDRKTMARVYVDVDGVPSSQPCIVSLYGSKAGVDLPGSPLALYHSAPSTINREVLGNTANFMLPSNWDEGTVTFRAKVRDLFERESASGNIPLTFTAKETPTYWIVTINTGTASAPNIVSNDEIATQVAYLKAIYPVPDVNFVRKPWETIGPTTVGNTIDELNDLYGQVFLAWIFGLLFTGGEPPFDLPDQIFGIHPGRGGISNPLWGGGVGVVARGGRGSSEEGTMAHELIHNLGPGDCGNAAAGFWGRHVSSLPASAGSTTGWCTPGETGVTYGCDATGPDMDWQTLFNDGDIREVGVDFSVSPPRIIPDTTPDIMTYCGSGSLPTKWISPYRWQKMFNKFGTLSLAVQEEEKLIGVLAKVADVYYVSGGIYLLKEVVTGKLNPVIVAKGTPMKVLPEGPYQIRLLNGKGESLLVHSFYVEFFEREAGEDQNVPFSFQLPAVQGVAVIVLMQGQRELDRIAVSESPPEVRVDIPNGGEVWKGGKEKIQWSAQDRDGDRLSFSVLYTPDGGKTWIPVAKKVKETSYEVDSSTLPGGEKALIRVIATDGFHTAQDDSNQAFTVLRSAPDVQILEPGEGALFEPGTMIRFVGTGTDKEDAAIPDESFVWSFGDTVFATGRDVHAALPNGFHLITLAVFDSDDMEGTASVEIQVAPVCSGDFTRDGDVDGMDLWEMARIFKLGQGTPELLALLAEQFGRNDCAVLPLR